MKWHNNNRCLPILPQYVLEDFLKIKEVEVEPVQKVKNALKTERIIMVLFTKFCMRKSPASV